jgi:hypothetical protein
MRGSQRGLAECRSGHEGRVLAHKGLAREIRAKVDAPVWHENDDGRFALKITRAGREAIGVEDEDADDAASAAKPRRRGLIPPQFARPLYNSGHELTLLTFDSLRTFAWGAQPRGRA